jgi:two-component system, LytTR family, sensor kinase
MAGPLHIDDHDLTIRHWPTGRELAGIAAFWLAFGALSVTNWLLPPGGQGPPMTSRVVAIGMVESILWMLATPPLFWFTSRFSIDARRRAWRVLLYVAIAVVVALAVDILAELVRRGVLPPPPARGPRRADRGSWFFVRARYFNDIMFSFGVLAGGVARDYVRRYQRRLEESARLRAQLAEARLSVLQSQLNPHFLFNTLNAVSALVDRDPKGVRRMIARLSELLRGTLEPSSDPEVPLARELATIEQYLEILRIRFQGRLETSIESDAALADALVPPMILQPLVENAMKHAVSRTAAPSRIDVVARRNGESLVLTVRDTGAGEDDNGSAGGEQGTGIGLRNTRARLEAIYGDDFSLDLARRDSAGTDATIRLPYHTASDLRAEPVR